MTKNIIMGFMVFMVASPLLATPKVDVAKCAAEKADATRLVCYDRLARTLGVDKPKSTTTAGKGKWVVRSTTSPIDDSVNVVLTLLAESPVQSGYNKSHPALFVRCSENKTNIFINWGMYLGLDQTQMLTRFDDAKASTSTWTLSTDNEAVFVRGSNVEFAKKLMSHKKILTQITPYNESPVMATFSIDGLTEAIKPLRKACNW